MRPLPESPFGEQPLANFSSGLPESVTNEADRISPQLLDVASLANRLGVKERFVRRLIAERRVPFCKIGKFIRFDPFEIEAWLNDRRVTATER